MNIFETVPAAKPSSNNFNLSFDHKLTTDMARLTPILVQELVPGDQFNIKPEVLIRMAPMLAPVMHRLDVQCHYFFVPNRILWSNWENFITGGLDGTNNSAFPTMNDFTVTDSSLGDYLGLPSTAISGAFGRVSALPFIGYQRIFNEYYRDENLGTGPINAVAVDGVQSAPLTTSFAALRTRAWRKDYFTSALPWPQKGANVLLPLSFNDVPVNFSNSAYTLFRQVGGANPTVGTPQFSGAVPQDALKDVTGNPLAVLPQNAVAGTSALTGNTTINEFRRGLRSHILENRKF